MTRALLALWLTLAAVAAVAQADEDWQRVRRLARGKEVAVDLKNSGERVTGDLAAVSDSAVVVRVGRLERSIARAEVRKVLERVPPRHRGLYMSIGIGLGLAAGFGASVPLLFKQCGANCNGEKAAVASLVTGLPAAGALAGRQLAGKGELELVYLGQ